MCYGWRGILVWSLVPCFFFQSVFCQSFRYRGVQGFVSCQIVGVVVFEVYGGFTVWGSDADSSP